MCVGISNVVMQLQMQILIVVVIYSLRDVNPMEHHVWLQIINVNQLLPNNNALRMVIVDHVYGQTMHATITLNVKIYSKLLMLDVRNSIHYVQLMVIIVSR